MVDNTLNMDTTVTSVGKIIDPDAQMCLKLSQQRIRYDLATANCISMLMYLIDVWST
jgi:hypothetical protein